MFNRVRTIWSMLVVLLASGMVAMAQEAPGDAAGGAAPAAPPAGGGGDGGFIAIIVSGGIVGILIWGMILLASFATIALIVDGAITTRRERILPVHLVAGVRASLDDGDLGGAMATCEHNPGPLSTILMTGFSNIADGYEVVQDAVAAATDLESEKILQRINYLNLCGQIAPMLGLLGTVTGMVQAFKTLGEVVGPQKDKLLSLSISTALWTTVAGLLISVPALLAFTLYKNMATRVLLECEATVLDLIKILRNAEVDDEEEEDEYE